MISAPALRWILLPVLALLAFAGCSDDGDPVTSIPDRNVILGTVFIDLDRDGTQGATDFSIADAPLSVRFLGGVPIQSVRTDSEGQFLASGLPPGQVFFDVSSSVLGDSLEVVSQNPDPLVLSRSDTVAVDLSVSYRLVSGREALDSPIGTRVFVEGLALAGSGALPGQAVHLRGVDGQPVRAVVVSPSGFALGDSIRILGRVQASSRGPILAMGQLARLGEGASPEPVDMNSGTARTADSGQQEGQLVRIEGATVTQTSVAGGIARIRVNDGSGPISVGVPTAQLAEGMMPVPGDGSRITVIGVLIPESSSSTAWELRTRRSGDLSFETLGRATGQVFLDRNDSGTFDPGDEPAVGALVRLAPVGIGASESRDVLTDAEGRFVFTELPTGQWSATVDPFTVPGSWSVIEVTPDPITIQDAGTTQVRIRFGVANATQGLNLNSLLTEPYRSPSRSSTLTWRHAHGF